MDENPAVECRVSATETPQSAAGNPAVRRQKTPQSTAPQVVREVGSKNTGRGPSGCAPCEESVDVPTAHAIALEAHGALAEAQPKNHPSVAAGISEATPWKFIGVIERKPEGRSAAAARLMASLREHIGDRHAFERVIAGMTEDLQDQGIDAEMAEPGTGAAVVIAAVLAAIKPEAIYAGGSA